MNRRATGAGLAVGAILAAGLCAVMLALGTPAVIVAICALAMIALILWAGS